MIKVIGVSQCHGKLQDGSPWENYHLYYYTDKLQYNNQETLIKGFCCVDQKINRNVMNNLGFPVSDLVGKEIEFVYEVNGRFANISGIHVIK